MSRNISVLEKAIIIILVVGFIVGGGGYLLVRPAYNAIERVDVQINQKKIDIDNARKLIAHAREVEFIYAAERERATTVFEGFWWEMTTNEAITETQKLLNGANNNRGHEAYDGISVTDINEKVLFVLPRLEGRKINYELRKLALMFAKGTPEADPDEEVEFFDPVDILLEVTIGRFPAEDDQSDAANEIRTAYFAKRMEYIENPVIFWRDITDALRENKILAGSRDRLRILDMMRLDLASERIGIGVINVEFQLEITPEEYRNFLDYLNNYPLWTYVDTCELWQTTNRNSGDIAVYDFKLFYYVMMPIDPPPPPKNPFSAADLDELESYGEGIERPVDVPADDTEE